MARAQIFNRTGSLRGSSADSRLACGDPSRDVFVARCASELMIIVGAGDEFRREFVAKFNRHVQVGA